jgi:hypothetical protein
MAVVGSGIGGMAAAFGLLDRGVPADQISLYDAAADSRGRLATMFTHDGLICEPGAARFNIELHPLLAALVAEHDVTLRPFQYRTTYGPDVNERLLRRFRDLELLPPVGAHRSFIAAVRAAAPRDADRFCALIGYGALTREDFPYEGGIELIDVHPEAFRCTDRPGTWVAPEKGFSQVIDRLRAALTDRGVAFRYHHRLEAVTEGQEGVSLRFATPDGVRAVDVDRLMLALSPGELAAIDHPWPVVDGWIDRLVQIPVFKCFFTFRPGTWPFGPETECRIAENDLQKLYLAPALRTAFFYCDSEPSLRWRDVHSAGLAALTRTATATIDATVGPVDWSGLDQVLPTFWPAAVTYLADTDPDEAANLSVLSDRAALCTEAFSPWPGWIEGALWSADRGAARMTEADAA